MEFEKLQKIIAEVLNLSEEEIRPDSTFVDDLGADSLDVFQIIMESKKSLTLRSIMMTLSRSLQLEMLLSRSRMQQTITRQI